ncbi:MAG: hypothetical protein R2861_01220 [Desulfobacterales bacterium]
MIADREIKPLIVDIADAMNAHGYSPGLGETLDQCMILMACHSAIRPARPFLSGNARTAGSGLTVATIRFTAPRPGPRLSSGR